MRRAASILSSACVLSAALAAPAAAQTSAAKPWGRVSFFTNTSKTTADGMATRTYNELTSSVTYQFPDLDDDGLEYGLDLRHTRYSLPSRPDRTSVYEGYVGARFGDGVLRVRAGNLWLNDLGGLGSVAGGLLEVRQSRLLPSQGRLRGGFFAGLEPNVLDVRYAENITKGGAYLAYDADRGRRHVVGLVAVRNAALMERAVLTVTNFLPVSPKVFVYQVMEYDLREPAGMAKKGLAYFFANARWIAAPRVELQGNYNRGRSIDARTLSDDVLNGRPLTQSAVDGFLYESIGGRVTVEVIPRVRIYGGYAQDRNDRDSAPTGRMLVGGYANNVAGSGTDLAASDSFIDRPTGRYQSQYASLGRQLGRHVYVTADYSTSLSVVRYSRSDGIIVELRPHTTRYSGSTNINLSRLLALLLTLDRTVDDSVKEFRLLGGITVRIR